MVAVVGGCQPASRLYYIDAKCSGHAPATGFVEAAHFGTIDDGMVHHRQRNMMQAVQWHAEPAIGASHPP